MSAFHDDFSTAIEANALVHKTVKSLLIIHETNPYLLLIRGDHSLNETKTTKLLGGEKFRFANQTEIIELLKSSAGFIGPVNIPSHIKVIADTSVVCMSDFPDQN